MIVDIPLIPWLLVVAGGVWAAFVMKASFLAAAILFGVGAVLVIAGLALASAFADAPNTMLSNLLLMQRVPFVALGYMLAIAGGIVALRAIITRRAARSRTGRAGE
jgi:hypothetical protein